MLKSPLLKIGSCLVVGMFAFSAALSFCCCTEFSLQKPLPNHSSQTSDDDQDDCGHHGNDPDKKDDGRCSHPESVACLDVKQSSNEFKISVMETGHTFSGADFLVFDLLNNNQSLFRTLHDTGPPLFYFKTPLYIQHGSLLI